MRFEYSVTSVVTLSLLLGSAALAGDVDAAKKYVAEAQAQADSNSYDDAKSKLELAETELEDVPAADKAPVLASIAAVKKQIGDATISVNKIKYTRELNRLMDEAEGSIGNLVTWPGVENELNELFNNADAQTALGDAFPAARKKFATFKKLNTKKTSAAKVEQLEAGVKDLETTWTETKAKIAEGGADYAVEQFGRQLEDVRKNVAQLPEDSEPAKAFSARVDAVGAEYVKLALAGKVKEKAEELTRAWELYKDEWDGWEKETVGPTFEAFGAEQNEKISALLAPKSRALVSRANGFMKNREDDDAFKKLQSSAEIKAIIDKITADRATALAKMENFADAILVEAEKETLDARKIDAIKSFEDGLKNNLEGSTKLEGMDKRALALVAKFEGNAAAGATDAAAFYKDSTEKAAAAWPALKAQFTVVDGFDPNNAADLKGKFIVIQTDNLMGYKFKPGDFPFATTVDGVPVACKYSPAVKAGVKDVETKMGRSLGDSDDDGRWEIIARVEGTTGRLTKKVDVEGKIKDEAGNEATVTGERAETVDAPILTIVAARCGPLAAGGK